MSTPNQALTGRVVLLCLLATAPPLAAQQPTDSLVVDVGGRTTVLRSLAGLPRATASSTLHNQPPQRFSGVSLRAVLEHAGFARTPLRGPALAQIVVLEARDGYRVTFGVADLDTSLVAHTLLLADSLDGHALPANEGPWRLVVAGDRGGARSIRMVTAIRVRDVSPP